MDILIEEFEGNIWAAALENGRLEGLEIDPSYEIVRWGSIYLAKVTRIDAALDAAFLDLDGENSGILFNKDIRLTDENGKPRKGGDKPIGKILSAGQMVAVQAKSAYLAPPQDQFEHDPFENKLPQMSMDITLQGRHLVYGTQEPSNRISSRIRGKKRRAQLEKMLEILIDMKGFILRSSAADLQTEILLREANILRMTWERITPHLKEQTPALIMQGPDSIQRILSDFAITPIERIEICTMDHFAQVEEWCSVFAPDLVTKIVPVEIGDGDQELALFEYRDIIGQIESLFYDYILLPDGSNIIIQETAALTAIDINKSTDKRSKLAINIDAAKEIARQIRLRNIGGIIVVDFLKMSGKEQEKELLKVLDEETYSDPCTVQIHGMTKLGLVEITRKRRTPPLLDRLDSLEDLSV